MPTPTTLAKSHRASCTHAVSSRGCVGANGSNSQNFQDPNSIDSYEAEVTVTEVLNTGASPRARLTGFFYNDGDVGMGGSDQLGEVQGEIDIRHNGNQLQVAFFVSRCDNDPCTAFTDLIFDNTTFGPVSFNEPHTLSIEFTGTSFIFGFDGDTAEVDVTGFSPNIQPSQYTSRTGFKFKGIGTRVSGIGSPDEGAFISARFDNVVQTRRSSSTPWMASSFGSSTSATSSRSRMRHRASASGCPRPTPERCPSTSPTAASTTTRTPTSGTARSTRP